MTLRRIAALLPRPKAASRSTRWIQSRALARPLQGGIDGVAVVRLGARLALGEADGLAAGDIDSGQQDQLGRGREIVHGSSCGDDAESVALSQMARVQRVAPPSPSIQLARSRMPASPDFSGWNCVADSGPFSTAARNGVPYVAPRQRGLRERRLHVEQPLLRGERVHEVEALVLDAAEQPRALRRARPCSSPCAAARARRAR